MKSCASFSLTLLLGGKQVSKKGGMSATKPHQQKRSLIKSWRRRR
jgi:hypothetical protein